MLAHKSSAKLLFRVPPRQSGLLVKVEAEIVLRTLDGAALDSGHEKIRI